MSASRRSIPTLIATIAALVFLFVPLATVVLFSFHSTASLSFPFEGFSLRWYDKVLGSAEFRAAARNSFFVALAACLITLVVGTLTAYGLARTASRARTALTVLFFLPVMLPGLFVGLALLVYFSELKVPLSLGTVLIAHCIFVFPFFLLIARAALDRIDPALEEAAADLGASQQMIFRRVTLPQVWPVLAGAAALVFALSFDEFIITFFVVGPDSTLPLYVWSSLRRNTDPSINTISTLLLITTMLPCLIAYGLALHGRSREVIA
jgi:ABC-type spermidine/putrescine transport system permease subunit II